MRQYFWKNNRYHLINIIYFKKWQKKKNNLKSPRICLNRTGDFDRAELLIISRRGIMNLFICTVYFIITLIFNYLAITTAGGFHFPSIISDLGQYALI